MKSNLSFILKDYFYLGAIPPDNMVVVPDTRYDLVPDKYRDDGKQKDDIRLFMEPWLLDKIVCIEFHHIKVKEYLDLAPYGSRLFHEIFVNLRGESSQIMELKLIFG